MANSIVIHVVLGVGYKSLFFSRIMLFKSSAVFNVIGQEKGGILIVVVSSFALSMLMY